jgi:hypothetical protein
MVAKRKTRTETRATKPGFDHVASQLPLTTHTPRDYSHGLSGLNLSPEVVEAVNQLMADDPRNVLDQIDRELQLIANEKLEQVRLEILAQEAERKLLWGNKFPRVLGLRPGEVYVEKPQKRHRKGWNNKKVVG